VHCSHSQDLARKCQVGRPTVSYH